MSGARLKHYGWGREDEGMTAEEQAFVLGRYHAKFARDAFETKAVPRLEDLELRAPRVALPSSLAAFCTSERFDRVPHTYGKSYPDYVRAMLGDYDSAPDVVAYPRNEAEISAVMDWAGGVSASLTPFGGGSSVCGGVEPRVDGLRYKAAVTLDLRNLGKVVEVDQISRAALIEGQERNDPGMAAKFRPSSMEYVRSLGGDPFTMVSEMPLFLRPLEEGETGRPDDPHFRAFLDRITTRIIELDRGTLLSFPGTNDQPGDYRASGCRRVGADLEFAGKHFFHSVVVHHQHDHVHRFAADLQSPATPGN